MSHIRNDSCDVNELVWENEKLREEVMLLHSLIKEAVPVFSKITEEVEDDADFSGT